MRIEHKYMLIAAIVIMACGLIGIIVGNVHSYKARKELFAKRPDLMNYLFGWQNLIKHMNFRELYRAEFPESTRLKYALRWSMAGVAAWFIGWLLLLRVAHH